MCQLIEYRVSTLKRPVASVAGIPQLIKLIYIYGIIYSEIRQRQQQPNNLRTNRSREVAIISSDITVGEKAVRFRIFFLPFRLIRINNIFRIIIVME